MSGIVNVIVVSSDDEESSPKRIKCEVKPSTEIDLKVNTKKISSTNVVVIDDDDDIICIGEDISKEKTSASLNSEISVKPPVPKNIKRVELTTLSPKIETAAEFKTSSNDEKCISTVTVAQIDDLNKASSQDVVSSSGIPAEEEFSKEETEIIPEFIDFIETCSQCECSKKYKDMVTKKIPTLMAKYMAIDQEYVNSKKFKKILQYSIEKIKRKPSNLIIHFNDVYQELRSNKVGDLELTEKQSRQLAMLNRAMRKVHKRIQRLEAKDAELDDDNNSGFLMVARYHERLCSIYKKICSITGESYHSSRSLYKSLDMNSSRYQVLNKAVDRLYNKTKTFPSFYDMDKCVRQSIEKNNLKISDTELELEIQKLFRDAGDIIQRRRKYELFENMSYYTENEPEPDDKELEDLMNMRLKEREKQINKIIEDYTYKQTIGLDVTVSPDSEDSNLQSEEESD